MSQDELEMILRKARENGVTILQSCDHLSDYQDICERCAYNALDKTLEVVQAMMEPGAEEAAEAFVDQFCVVDECPMRYEKTHHHSVDAVIAACFEEKPLSISGGEYSLELPEWKEQPFELSQEDLDRMDVAPLFVSERDLMERGLPLPPLDIPLRRFETGGFYRPPIYTCLAHGVMSCVECYWRVK